MCTASCFSDRRVLFREAFIDIGGIQKDSPLRPVQKFIGERSTSLGLISIRTVTHDNLPFLQCLSHGQP